MQITEIEAKQELQALASLVYNSKVLAATAPYVVKEAFKSQFSFSIAERCVKYHTKYGRAPRNLIHDYLETEIQNSSRKEEVKHLQSILDNLSTQKKTVTGTKCNNEYLIDKTSKYLKLTRLGTVLQETQDAYNDGSLDKMENLVSKLNRISLNGNGHVAVDPFLDPLHIEQAFDEGDDNVLLKYPGPLGAFFGYQLARDNFIVLQGAEKSFKSFWLQEFMYRGLKNQLRVMFVGIGDMSLKQYNRRLYARIAYRPWHKEEYWYPTGWKPRTGGFVLPKRIKKRTSEKITVPEIEKSVRKFNEKYLQTEKLGKYIKMMAVGEISMLEIETAIKRYQDSESWTPDIVIVDYADRLSPPKGVNDKIMAIDHNWNHMRALALDHHSLMLTGTQVRRTGYKGWPQTREDVADSKNKTAVVTGMIGICAFPEEFKTDTRRLNWVVCREHTKRSIVSVAACPTVGHPCVLSI